MIIRALIALLALLLIALVTAMALAESFLVRTLENQLSTSDIEAKTISLVELRPGQLTFGELSLASADWQAQLLETDIVVDQTLSSWFHAEYVALSLSTGDSGGPTSTVGELLATLEDNLGYLPVYGAIDELRYCQPGLCIDAQVGWNAQNGNVTGEVYLPVYEIWLTIERDDDWTISISINANEADVLADLAIAQTSTLLNVDKSVTARLKQSPEGLTAEVMLQKLSLTGVSKLPLTSTADEVINELISNNQLAIEGLVEAKLQDMTLSSSGRYQFGVDYFEQDVRLSSQVVPELKVEVATLANGLVNVEPGNTCTISLGLGAVDCSIGSVSSSWDIQHELGEFAADVNLRDVTTEFAFGDLEAAGQLELVAFDLGEGAEVVNANLGFDFKDQTLGVETQENTSSLLGASVWFQAKQFLQDESGSAQLTWQAPAGLRSVIDYGGAKFLTDEALLELAEAVAGDFEIKSQLQWSFSDNALQLVHETSLALDNLTLAYDGYEVSDGGFDSTLHGYPELSGKFFVTAGGVDVGVPFIDVKFDADVEVDLDTNVTTLVGERFEFKLLGGKVTSQLMSYHHPEQAGIVVLDIEGIQLEQLLALQQQQLDSSGVLSGSVPVQLVDGNLSVTNAEIAAQAPGGFIRYVADPAVRSLAESNVGVGVVLDAMENFQYHTLDASVDYFPDGQMLARTSVKGANPDYQDGREVHLNLSLQENILVLLQSLRLGSDLAEQIGEKRDRFTN
jgi:hypothetical protein